MAWTAPRTWVTAEVVTASNMNTHVRDNFLETAPAKATSAGGLIVATGTNTIAQRGIQADNEGALEATSSSTYTDLTTSGPAVTVTTGTLAIVLIGCRMTSSTAGSRPSMSYAVSGASTVSATEASGVQAEISVAGDFYLVSHHVGQVLTAGSNTFTAKYASLVATSSTFGFRRIAVIPVN